jgi:hypothetical protein
MPKWQINVINIHILVGFLGNGVYVSNWSSGTPGAEATPMTGRKDISRGKHININ